MKYIVTSVIRFRTKWRAEIHEILPGGKLGSGRIRRVVNASDEEEAWKQARAIAAELSYGESECLTTLLEAFIGTLDDRPIAESTKDGYRKSANRAMLYFAANPLSVESFGREAADEYIRSRIAEGASPNTLHHEVSVLRIAANDRGIGRDLFAGVTLPKRTRKAVDTDRVKDLLGSIEGKNGAIAWLAFGCQLYPSEIAAIHADDVPEGENVVHVRSAVGQDGVLHVAARARTVELYGTALRRMRTYGLSRQDKGGYLFGVGSEPGNPQVISRSWSAVAKAFGLDVTLSDLRILGGQACI